MKLDDVTNVATMDDAALVAEVLNGDREAFGQLVARYQSAVCALAYSACGNLAQSEDLAQETFIIAWRKLATLEDPTKFKSWLYGIARNLIHNSFRKQTRNPIAVYEPLDDGLTTVASAANPTDQAISKEEEAILWRSLEQIPETYREPLVLFYREHHSIERVAAVLDMSEEAARQRLSRGRKLLQERVIAFVEGALENTAPGPAFTLGVLAVLPAVSFSAKAATVSAAAKGGSVATGTTFAAFFGKFLGPLIPFLGMFAGYRQMKKAGFPKEALKSLKWFYIMIAVSVLLMIGVVSLVEDRNAALIKASPTLFVIVSVGLIVGYFAFIGLLTAKHMRRMKAALGKEVAAGTWSLNKQFGSAFEYRSKIQFLGLPLIHIRRGFQINHASFTSKWTASAAKGWIAIADSFAIGGLFAYGGVAIAPISIGGCAIGILSYGGMAIAAIAWAGFSFGIWAFGAVTFGWNAFSGGSAIAWHLAAGYEYAVAHHYAVTHGVAHAAEVNTPYAINLFESSWCYRFCVAYSPAFFWLMWAWAIPMMLSMFAGLFRIGKRKKATA